MLIGQYSTRLTDKGRSALPKNFRKIIGRKAYIAKWYEGCLVIIGEGRWSELIGRLSGTSRVITRTVRDTDRFILGSAFEFETDSQGRFMIPKALRQFAGLKKEIVFVGLLNRVEVWDKSEWEKKENLVQKSAESLVESLAESYTDREEKR